MKLGCVLTACDLNPRYMVYIPIFVRTWQRTHPDVDVKVVLIADEVPEELRGHLEHIILLSPPAGVDTAFAAQCVRLLYPGLLDCAGAVMITDVDCLPLSSTYYRRTLEGEADDKFVSTCGMGYPYRKQLPMMHAAALPSVWRDVFEVSTPEEAVARLRRMYGRAPNAKGTLRYWIYHTVHGVGRMVLKDLPRMRSKDDWKAARVRYRLRFKKYFWGYDEKELHRRAKRWNRRTGNLVLQDGAAMGRRLLVRHEAPLADSPGLAEEVAAGVYSGYHGPRKYRPVVEEIAALAPRPGGKGAR